MLVLRRRDHARDVCCLPVLLDADYDVQGRRRPLQSQIQPLLVQCCADPRAPQGYLFEDTLIVQGLENTALIAACVVAITPAVALPAGYSLARTPGRSGENLGIGIF